jgi:hypothetical protein
MKLEEYMSRGADDEESVSSEDSRIQELQKKVVKNFAECTSVELEELYRYYKSSRDEMRGLIGQPRADRTVKQAIYGSYVEQAYLLLSAASDEAHDEARTFFAQHKKEFDGLGERRRIFLDMYRKDIEPDKELEQDYDEYIAKQAALQKKAKAEPAAVVDDEKPDHVVIDIPDSGRSVPPPAVVRKSDTASVATSHRDDDERTMYSAQSVVVPRVMRGARTTTASPRGRSSGRAESVVDEEEMAERLSAITLSARDVARKLPGTKTSRSSDTSSVSDWVDEVDSSVHDDPSAMHRADARQVVRDDDFESLHERSVAQGVEEIYGEIRVFSVPGGKKGYLDNVMEEHFREMPQQHLKLSPSDDMKFAGAVNQRMAEDLKKGVLKNIEPEPVTPKISKYNIKGHILEEIENDNGTIDFKPEPGLNGVVRVQRRNEKGSLIDAYDTIEYQEGKVSRLIISSQGFTRLGDIGLLKEKGVLVAGEMSPEEQTKFASMSVSTPREEVRRRVPAGIPKLDFSKLHLPHVDGEVAPSERVSPTPTPRGGPVRVLRPGSHTPGSGRK